MVVKNGVYKITNMITGQIYIGSAAGKGGFEKRWAKAYNDYLTRSIKKYGDSNFRYEILVVCPPEDCLKYEQEWLDRLQPWADTGAGFNICKVAGSLLGTKNSEETKRKKGLAQRGKIVSRETREKQRVVKLGKPHQPMLESTKEKIRLWNVNKKVSPETIQNMSTAQTRRRKKEAAEGAPHHLLYLAGKRLAKPR